MVGLFGWGGRDLLGSDKKYNRRIKRASAAQDRSEERFASDY